MVRNLFASLFVAVDAKKYARGLVRHTSNAHVDISTITDEMRTLAPESLDWTTKGATTGVKDQGGCGSCWAYSATEGIESGLFMETGQLIRLSNEEIISCDKVDGGCLGGDLPTAFEWVKNNGGLDTEEDFPDQSAEQPVIFVDYCDKTKMSKKKIVEITDYKYAIPPCTGGDCNDQNESDMMAALAIFGPLSVCVNADGWDEYAGGIFTTCGSAKYKKLDHCVQLVGYDTTGSQPYWKVRNSWATEWGEDGFIRLPMGQNACGIADEAMYVKAAMVTLAV